MKDKIDEKIRRAIFQLLKEQPADPFDTDQTDTFGTKSGKQTDPFGRPNKAGKTKKSKEKKSERPSDKDDKTKKANQKPGSKKERSQNNQGVISTAGAFGSGGRAKAFVTSAGARAESDPEGLLEDLGVTSADGGSDLEKAQSILASAIYSNVVMSEAYSGTRITTDSSTRSSDAGVKEVVAIRLGSLDRKNGVRFLAHTLVAAQNAGILGLSAGLQFAEGQSNPIIIYSV